MKKNVLFMNCLVKIAIRCIMLFMYIDETGR